jgi:hypothetical protein
MRCECQKCGALYSGLIGVLAAVPDSRGRRYIERCDACERFHSDEAAALEYAKIKGGGCCYDGRHRIIWTPA